MTTLNKILLILLGITILGSVGFIIYKENEISNKQDTINKSIVEFQQLKDDIARSQSSYATADSLNAFAKQNGLDLNDIKNNLDTLKATITGLNQITVASIGTNVSNVPSTSTTPNPTPQTSLSTASDPFGYNANEQHLALNENFSGTQIPVGSVGFSAWQKTPWEMTIYPRTYSITNVLGTDENNRHYVYNKFSINANGTDYPVKITDAKFMEEYPDPHFTWWNPRLALGVDVGIDVSRLPITGELIPNLSLGIMSYGKSLIGPDWSFVNLGVGYGAISKRPQFQLSPFEYNIGQQLPLINNTYIGPSIGIGTNGDFNVSIGVKVGL